MKKYEKDETRIIDRAWNKSGLDIVDISGICIMTQTVFLSKKSLRCLQ